MAEAVLKNDSGAVQILAPAALANGEVIQLGDGRAGVVAGSGAGFASGDPATIQVKGIYTVQKTASVALLDGQELYWVESTGKCNYTGDFRLGCLVGDAASADTTCNVDLNVAMVPYLDSGRDPMIVLQTADAGGSDSENPMGVVYRGGGLWGITCDAVAEAYMGSVQTMKSIPLASKPIFEGWLEVIDDADTADKLDINFGLANAGHATDFDSVTEAIAIHVDGEVLNILAESDDGVATEVAATDTTKDLVLGTAFFVQIDCRSLADPQIYINGVERPPGFGVCSRGGDGADVPDASLREGLGRHDV